ncbi:MAG: N-acetylmuramoyl-L-alanine amidase [Phycisphaerales bacterium JB040]
MPVRAVPLVLMLALASCTSPRPVVERSPEPTPPVEARADPIVEALRPRPGDLHERLGDEIMVAGRLVHTGAPVRLWFDPPHYDAYRVTYRFKPEGERAYDPDNSDVGSPNRYGDRAGMPEGGWTLPTLARRVDQFVIHYDVAGVSRSCFRILHDLRGLSVHFMIDVDGTIYQTLDVAEKAWHATIANDRSVGVEMAQIGAYPPGSGTLDEWYETGGGGADGAMITLPGWLGDGGVRTPGPWFASRSERVTGTIQGRLLEQHDFTDAQYASLIRLTAALHAVLPGIRLDVPRDPAGNLLTRTLGPDEFGSFSGLLGHYHIQENKIDPGPAFDWERVLRGARLLRIEAP